MSMPPIAINEAADGNRDFRRVVFTGAKSQLVVMRIPPGGEIGEETHAHVEQTLYFRAGSGVAMLNGTEYPVKAEDAVVVTPNTRHNFRNTGAEDMVVITMYAPPNHIDGRVHATKADADADAEDEAFGHAI